MDYPDAASSPPTPPRPAPPAGFGRAGRGGGFVAIRSVLVGLGLLLGLVLLSRGLVVIGGILVVMAALRIVMLVQMHRRQAWRMERREQFANRMHQRRVID